MSNNKQTHGFCKIPQKKCTLSYCDENGCIYERTNLVGEPTISNNKQSSVEWLVEEITVHLNYDQRLYFRKTIEQAKARHKEEIIEARIDGDTWSTAIKEMRRNYAELYYNETYGGNK